MVTQAQARATNAQTSKQLLGIPKRLGREFSGLFKHWTNVQVGDVSKNFRGRPGLVRWSGHLQDSIKSRTVAGDDLNKVTSEAYSAGTARFTKTRQDYSRVQEVGATIRPIPPNRALVFIDNSARGNGEMFIVKKVVIPPRLRFYDSFRARAAEREAQLTAAAVKAINRKA